jgi:flavin-dependent dehydrogenase
MEKGVSPTEIKSTWEVVVIGAGPAGSIAARECAKQGLRTLLVDKAAFPRPKVCGCCLNANAMATLERLGLGGAVARLGPAQD